MARRCINIISPPQVVQSKAGYCCAQLAGGYQLKDCTLQTYLKPPEIEKEAQTDDTDYVATN